MLSKTKTRIIKHKFFLFLLLSLVFLLCIKFAYAQCSSGCYISDLNRCVEPGTVYKNQYCNYDAVFENQKEKGENCMNNYECSNSYCLESGTEMKCQPKYTLVEQDLWDKIYNFVTGKECIRNENCPSGKICNSEGKCVTPGNGGGGGGGGGGGCTSVWSCTIWSNSAELCGTRTCTDSRSCHTPSSTKPIELKTCPAVPEPEPEPEPTYCGDGTCDVDENCGEANFCEWDCGACPEEIKRVGIVGWLIIIIILVGLIGLVSFLIYKNTKETGQRGQKPIQKPMQKPYSGTGMRYFRQPITRR